MKAGATAAPAGLGARQYDTVLFDLDGTLSDSAPGILGSLRAAFVDNDLPPLSESHGRALLGPPFYESLPPIIGTDRVAAVIDAYRRHYAIGMYDTSIYPGVADLVTDLRARGVTLALATSKPEAYARPILEHLGVADAFTAVVGDTLGGSRRSKSLVVGEALARLGRAGPDGVVMVGDRSHDVHGAAAHGIGCLGAGWGYGAPGELSAAGALRVFDTAAALQETLQP